MDPKTASFRKSSGEVIQSGEPIHEMRLRLIYDEDMVVREVVAETEAAPYAQCADAAPSLHVLRGLSMSAGWSQEIRSRLGGAKGCTHLTQMLQPMATTAFPTIARVRHSRPVRLDAFGRPGVIDSCRTYAADGEVVAMRWPEHARPKA